MATIDKETRANYNQLNNLVKEDNGISVPAKKGRKKKPEPVAQKQEKVEVTPVEKIRLIRNLTRMLEYGFVSQETYLMIVGEIVRGE